MRDRETEPRVIITGASGLIGKSTVALLHGAGYRVTALTRDAAKARAVLGEAVEVRRWDGKSAAGWADALDGALGVINLAGENIASGRWTKAKKRKIVESRESARSALWKVIENTFYKPQVLIQASAVGYYGKYASGVHDESSPAGQGFLADVAQSWEGEATDTGTVRLVTVRLGLVLSPDGGIWPRLLRPFRFFVGGTLGSGEQWFSWVHIADVVGALQYVLENPQLEGVFNLTSPHPVTMKEFCRLLGQVLHRPAWTAVPGFVLRIAFGEMADEALLASQQAVPGRLLDAGYRFQFPDPESAIRHLSGSL